LKENHLSFCHPASDGIELRIFCQPHMLTVAITHGGGNRGDMIEH